MKKKSFFGLALAAILLAASSGNGFAQTQPVPTTTPAQGQGSTTDPSRTGTSTSSGTSSGTTGTTGSTGTTGTTGTTGSTGTTGTTGSTGTTGTTGSTGTMDGATMSGSTASGSGTGSGSGTRFGGRERRGGSTGRDLTLSAARSADHTILFRALRVSGLTDQASGKGPYTVFAPTDQAFNSLAAGTVENLMKPANKQRLVRLLAAHVVKGSLSAEQLQDGQTLKTLTGATLTVSKEGETVTITDAQGNAARVVHPDIKATNGTVHAIDAVLVPAR